MSKPITREEQLLSSISTGEQSGIEPITREEQYLAYIANESDKKPKKPITRKEIFLDAIAEKGSGGGGVKPAVIEPLTVTENGEYTAPEGVDGYSPVNVNVQSGGGDTELVDKVLTLEGDCRYKFANGKWDWVVTDYGNRIKVGTIERLTCILADSEIEELPFDLNITADSALSYSTDQAFYNSGLKKAPYIQGNLHGTANGIKLKEMFRGCEKLEYIPYDFFWVLADESQWEEHNQSTTACNDIFRECRMLQEIPDISMIVNKATSTSSFLANIFNGCFTLKKVENIPFLSKDVTYTSNAVVSMVGATCCLEKLTFAMDDGVAQIRNMKSQTLDLQSAGYQPSSSTSLTKYGKSADKKVTNDETYQALKNDPDWWTQKYEYSRYNHDSAVETVNSLPDTSTYLAEKGGTNTIKFKGASGSLTDGGAINTLTEEEIAVATAKGWTVTLS